MLDEIKSEVLEANRQLFSLNLTNLTWGNVSGIVRDKQLVVIKPSGVHYNDLTRKDLVIVDLNGKVVEGKLKPSSDTLTHLKLYKEFPKIGSVVHTHSLYATSWAQAGHHLPVYGTTHADYFYGYIPCTRSMKKNEIFKNYEKNTGNLIVETFKELSIDPNKVPSVLVKNHAPFSWGYDVNTALENALVLEKIAEKALWTKLINKGINPIQDELLSKHYLRKHGQNAYYGQ